MEIFIYTTIFIIGTLLGSFFTLAVYRLPLKQNITHKRSYCPNCNHKLEFLDLIPVLSYIFLGGKCRYCKQKIRARYILLELLSGVAFLLFVISLNINIYYLDISKIAYLFFGTIYFACLFLIAGIDKENHNVCKSVLRFGVISKAIYIIYLCTVQGYSVFRYVIYLFVILVLMLIDSLIYSKNKKGNYTLQILALCFYLLMCSGKNAIVVSIITTLIMVAIKEFTFIFKHNKLDKTEKLLPIAYYLCVTNLVGLIINNLYYIN